MFDPVNELVDAITERQEINATYGKLGYIDQTEEQREAIITSDKKITCAIKDIVGIKVNDWGATGMSDKEPNIVDAALELQEDGVGDLLSAIFDHQAKEREYFDGLIQTWWAQDKARMMFTRHGVIWALDSCEWGGTTREYELAFSKISAVLSTSQHGGAFWEEYMWYQEQCKDPVDSMTKYDVHPTFGRGYDA